MDTIVNIAMLSNGILHITLNRPEQLNALSMDVLRHLHQLFLDAKSDRTVHGVLLSGSGKAFCAGADITQLADLNGARGLQFAHYGQAVFRELEMLGKPSLAAIHGAALGGGCELAMAASLRIASEDASFGQPEIKLGVIPGFGGTQRLARLIGKGRALDLCLTGRRIAAKEAEHYGLVSEVVPPADLLKRAETILGQVTQFSQLALMHILNVVHQGYDMSLEEAFELEATYFGLSCATKDKQEGVSAFLQKRAPQFAGE
jgi:enoyl-CoA hydratase